MNDLKDHKHLNIYKSVVKAEMTQISSFMEYHKKFTPDEVRGPAFEQLGHYLNQLQRAHDLCGKLLDQLDSILRREE